MFRFLSVIWDIADQPQSAAAELLARRLQALSPQWREALDSKGLRVFCADARAGSLEPYALANQAGVVLGTLFERNRDPEDETPPRKAALGAQQTAAIVESRGQWLLANAWGNYVAFIADPATGARWVLKDPCGNLPCFSTSFRGVTLFFSNIADCMELGLPFTVNRSYLRSHLVAGMSQDSNPLNEVSQVQRGECAELSAGRVSRRFYWTPLSFPGSDALIEDPDRAARAMRATLLACTHSLASCHDNVLLRLSGGLDSSIVSGCLKDAPTHPRVTCYTYFNPRGRSDERPWARLAARHGGYEHIECSLVPENFPLADSRQMPPSVEPVPILGFLQSLMMEKALAAEHGSTAIFTGDGGDSGFCSESIGDALPEYFRLHGLRPAALRLAAQVALLVELSTWTVFARGLRKWRTGSEPLMQRDMVLKARKLVSADILETAAAIDHRYHPWFRSMNRVPGGMLSRVGMLAATPDFYNVSAEAGRAAPEVIAPLYSQPVVELLLRIPIHVHFEGGRDRGLARRAFAGEAPQPILQRLWKDRAPGFHEEVIGRNLDFLREFFLDGVLIREGLLNRAAVEQALSMTPAKNDVYPGELLGHMGTEIWARNFEAYQHINGDCHERAN